MLVENYSTNDRAGANLQAADARGLVRRLNVTVEDLCRGLHLVFNMGALFRDLSTLNALDQIGKGVTIRYGALTIGT